MIYRKQNGIAFIMISLIIFCVLAAGVAGYYFLVVKSDKTVKPTPELTLKNDTTSAWQTYNNDKYGYSIKYPENWYFHNTGFSPPPPTTIFLASTPEGQITPGDYASLEIYVDSEVNSILDEYGEVVSLASKGEKKTDSVIDGQKAIKLEASDTIASHASYYVLSNNKIYRLSYQYPIKNSNDKTVLENILSTFKFTK